MNEYRCHHCRIILYKGEGLDLDVEVLCPVCRRINYPARKDVGFGLRGRDFQAKSIDHNCYQCQRLLLRSIGLGKIETKCTVCKIFILYDTDLMRKGKFTYPKVDYKYTQLKKSIAR